MALPRLDRLEVVGASSPFAPEPFLSLMELFFGWFRSVRPNGFFVLLSIAPFALACTFVCLLALRMFNGLAQCRQLERGGGGRRKNANHDASCRQERPACRRAKKSFSSVTNDATTTTRSDRILSSAASILATRNRECVKYSCEQCMTKQMTSHHQ